MRINSQFKLDKLLFSILLRMLLDFLKYHLRLNGNAFLVDTIFIPCPDR